MSSKQKSIIVNLHGELGEALGRKTWKLYVNSVPQAFSAIESLSKRKFCKYLLECDRKGIKYDILINGRQFLYDKNNPPNPKDPNSIINTELCTKINKLETIDVIPSLEGGLTAILVSFLISAIVGVVMAVIINALTPGPTLEKFKERQKTSYLFSGPSNTINEGGCVPVGYGRLIVGSAVISTSYDIESFKTEEQF